MARQPGQKQVTSSHLAPRVPAATEEQLSLSPPTSASSAWLWAVGCGVFYFKMNPKQVDSRSSQAVGALCSLGM